MTTDAVVELLRHALLAAFWIAAPLMAIAFAAGVVISLAQIVTSIQDTAFSTIPRLIVFVLAILLLMPWMIQRITVYTTALLGDLGLVPIPGFQSGPRLARIVLSVSITMALFPLWPRIDAARADAPRMLLWVLPEIAVGVTIGLGVAFILEVFLMAAQILSLNAGFSFAQTIDPTTQGESGVLLVFAQLAGGMVFLSLGLDREVIRTLAYSLEAHPAGAWIARPAAVGAK